MHPPGAGAGTQGPSVTNASNPIFASCPTDFCPSRVASLDRGPRWHVKALFAVELGDGAGVPQRNNGERTGLGEPLGQILTPKLPMHQTGAGIRSAGTGRQPSGRRGKGLTPPALECPAV